MVGGGPNTADDVGGCRGLWGGVELVLSGERMRQWGRGGRGRGVVGWWGVATANKV